MRVALERIWRAFSGDIHCDFNENMTDCRPEPAPSSAFGQVLRLGWRESLRQQTSASWLVRHSFYVQWTGRRVSGGLANDVTNGDVTMIGMPDDLEILLQSLYLFSRSRGFYYLLGAMVVAVVIFTTSSTRPEHRCSSCQQPARPNATFCAHCGQQLDKQ